MIFSKDWLILLLLSIDIFLIWGIEDSLNINNVKSIWIGSIIYGGTLAISKIPPNLLGCYEQWIKNKTNYSSFCSNCWNNNLKRTHTDQILVTFWHRYIYNFQISINISFEMINTHHLKSVISVNDKFRVLTF